MFQSLNNNKLGIFNRIKNTTAGCALLGSSILAGCTAINGAGISYMNETSSDLETGKSQEKLELSQVNSKSSSNSKKQKKK